MVQWEDGCIWLVPSLKLTNRTWKWTVGRLVSFWDGLFSGAMSVSLSVTIVGWTHVELPWLWEEGYFSYLQSWMSRLSKVQSAGLAKWKGVRLLMLRMKKAILRLCFFFLELIVYMWISICECVYVLLGDQSEFQVLIHLTVVWNLVTRCFNQPKSPSDDSSSVALWCGAKNSYSPWNYSNSSPLKMDAWKMNFL